jgi:hypothetical protein
MLSQPLKSHFYKYINIFATELRGQMVAHKVSSISQRLSWISEDNDNKPTWCAIEIWESWIYSGLLRASKSYNTEFGSPERALQYEGHFTHETESPWPLLHFKHSHWWNRRSWSKFATSHYAWGTKGVWECKMDVKSTWIPNMVSNGACFMDYFQKPSLGGRPNTKPRDHGTPNTHNCWFILLYHAWGSAWIEIHWNSVWLRAWSHTTSHYTWGSVRNITWFWRCVGTAFWTLSFGLSQFHGHGSWLVCEVVLSTKSISMT